jgi:hypothetical protein
MSKRRPRTTYTPYSDHAWGGACQVCSSLEAYHHPDGHCYTTRERVAMVERGQSSAAPCPHCGERACEASCTGALLARWEGRGGHRPPVTYSDLPLFAEATP